MTPSPIARVAVTTLFGAILAAMWWLDHGAHSGSGTTLAPTLGFRLRETAQQHGIDFTHRATTLDPKLDNIAVQIAAVGASVAVGDFDADGWSDIYTTSSRFGAPNALYRNLGDGSFRDVAAAAGVAALNVEGEGVSMGALWGDYDNDGFEDLFVYRYGRQVLLRNRGDGTFEDVSLRAGLRRWMNSNGACWLDYDRDGFIDLYVTGYFSEQFDLWHLTTTRIMQESFEFARNGGHNYLFRNRGDGSFEDVTERTGCDSTRWTLAVAAADMDGDGWIDLYLANDYGPEEFFRNIGGTRFELQRGVGLEESSKSGMSVSLGDFENQGRFGVYVTNISKEHFLFEGNNLRINRLAERGRLINIADVQSSLAGERQIVDCGWSWGAQFGDLDNDGQLDLFVTNGFVSANRERDYWYAMTKIAGGSGAIIADAAAWDAQGDASLSGYEVSRVLRGLGRQRFEDVAAAVGVDDEFDGRAVAFADLFNRGKLDVLVANQGGPLLLYENEVAPSNHWIQLRMHATHSNRSAIGAQVTVHFAGVKQVQAVLAGSGFCAQNERRLHFGLGAANAVDKLEVRWPSGLAQTLTGLAVDRVHEITEPQP